jgi:hypothetical protein
LLEEVSSVADVDDYFDDAIMSILFDLRRVRSD